MENKGKLNFNLNFLNTTNYSSNNSKVSNNEIFDIQNLNEENQNRDEELTSTKIKNGDNSDINRKPLLIVAVIIIILCIICLVSYLDTRRKNTIFQIKNDAYEYLKNGNEYDFDNELKKLTIYGIDIDSVKNDMINKYDKEKELIISHIAYSYEHDKDEFNRLKQKYLSILFDNDENKFNQEIEDKLGYIELSLEPVALPESGIIHNYTDEEAIAPFKIITQDFDDNNYYIKLVDPYTDETKIVIFVRGGETIEVDVPLGTYKIKKASGNTWYGEDYFFGHNTQYTTSDDLLTFQISDSYITGHTLTLYKVTNGNFTTQKINKSDF